MKNKRNDTFGLIALIIISVLNVCFTLPLFVSMLVEQIRIGEGTTIEMGAIAIWILEGLCVVPLTVVIVFTMISAIKKDYLAKIIINITQIILYIVLHVLANLWMFL